MLKCNFDLDKKQMEMKVMLNGEKEPLSVMIKCYYRLVEEGSRYFLGLHDIEISRA